MTKNSYHDSHVAPGVWLGAPRLPTCRARCECIWHSLLVGSQPSESGRDSPAHNYRKLYFLYSFGLPKQSRTFFAFDPKILGLSI